MQSKPIDNPKFEKHRSATQILEALKSDIDTRTEKPKYPFGVRSIDNLIWGFQRSQLTIVGAQTSHGKSAFSIFGAWNIAKLGVPTVFLTLEMPEEHVIERLACIEFGLNGWKLLKGDRDERKRFEDCYLKLSARLNTAPFEIIGYAGRTLHQMEEIIKKFQPEFIFIDHAQKMSAKGYASKYEALSELAHRLQDLAIEHKCGIVLASQINRGGEYLKGSGDLEESADNLLYLNWKCHSDDKETDQTLFQVSVQKQRRGPCDYIDINFYPETYTFADRTDADRFKN